MEGSGGIAPVFLYQQRYMEVSDKLHILKALTWGREHPLPTGWRRSRSGPVAKRKISIALDKEMVNSVAVVSAGETGGWGDGQSLQITGVRQSGRKGAWAPICCLCFFLFLSIIICRLYKLTLSDQGQISLQVRVNLSDLV